MATAAQLHPVLLFGYVLPKETVALKAPAQLNTADAQRRLHSVEPSSTKVLRRNVSHATAACLLKYISPADCQESKYAHHVACLYQDLLVLACRGETSQLCFGLLGQILQKW